MVGPPGTNGFQALELEPNGNQWCAPPTLSQQQIDFIKQNLLAGNLYVAIRNSQSPNGVVRQQIAQPSVTMYTTSDSNGSGSAEGYVMVNETTGDYAITWNTMGSPSIVDAHLNDGDVANGETVIASLTQRFSNPNNFFAYGNVNDPNDAIPNLLTLLGDSMGWLDAHSSDGTRVYFGLLSKGTF